MVDIPPWMMAVGSVAAGAVGYVLGTMNSEDDTVTTQVLTELKPDKVDEAEDPDYSPGPELQGRAIQIPKELKAAESIREQYEKRSETQITKIQQAITQDVTDFLPDTFEGEAKDVMGYHPAMTAEAAKQKSPLIVRAMRKRRGFTQNPDGTYTTDMKIKTGKDPVIIKAKDPRLVSAEIGQAVEHFYLRSDKMKDHFPISQLFERAHYRESTWHLFNNEDGTKKNYSTEEQVVLLNQLIYAIKWHNGNAGEKEVNLPQDAALRAMDPSGSNLDKDNLFFDFADAWDIDAYQGVIYWAGGAHSTIFFEKEDGNYGSIEAGLSKPPIHPITGAANIDAPDVDPDRFLCYSTSRAYITLRHDEKGRPLPLGTEIKKNITHLVTDGKASNVSLEVKGDNLPENILLASLFGNQFHSIEESTMPNEQSAMDGNIATAYMVGDKSPVIYGFVNKDDHTTLVGNPFMQLNGRTIELKGSAEYGRATLDAKNMRDKSFDISKKYGLEQLNIVNGKTSWTPVMTSNNIETVVENGLVLGPKDKVLRIVYDGKQHGTNIVIRDDGLYFAAKMAPTE